MQHVLDAQVPLALSWNRLDASTLLLRLRGELELTTVGHLQDEAAGLLGQGLEDLVVDLSDVTFIDSAGISSIIWLYKRVRPLGSVTLVAPSSQRRTFLDMLQLQRLIPVYPTVDDALADLEG